MWGGSNLILGIVTENQIFILITPAAIKFLHQILKKWHFGVEKNHYPPRWICIAHMWSPTLFPMGIITYKGVLTKFNFSMKFQHLEKNCQFNEIPKIWAPKHFSLVGGGSNLILGTGMENQIFILRTPATVKFF